jgi:hypothetical protein
MGFEPAVESFQYENRWYPKGVDGRVSETATHYSHSILY